MASNRFAQLLDEQIAHEFAASQQYVAIAVWYGRAPERSLPKLCPPSLWVPVLRQPDPLPTRTAKFRSDR